MWKPLIRKNHWEEDELNYQELQESKGCVTESELAPSFVGVECQLIPDCDIDMEADGYW